jgi:hypothetical protein
MASADKPPTPPPADARSTAVKPAEGKPSTQVKPLPPPRTPAPERVNPRARGAVLTALDVVLVALVLAFAFLTALFPAHNSDFFLHAATGRLIAHAQYQLGHDPFSYATGGAYWVNPNWLYDLILYLIYEAGGEAVGGVILVIVKALMIAALAEVMVRAARQPGRSLWVPACCVGLAVLALSPRVALQPVCVSYLFLGVTCWLLRLPGQRRARAETAGAAPPRRPFLPFWFIPPLCLLWANLDGWFLLGPVTVALVLVGETVQEWFGPATEEPPAWRKARRNALGLTLLAAVAACVANPHHVRALVTPPPPLGLSPAAEALHGDEQFLGSLLSPFEQTSRGDWVYFHTSTGLSVAGMAFFPLVLLGAASFAAAVAAGRWRWGRALLFAAFLALAVWHAAAIPFFAVVAGPVASLNFLDFAAKRLGAAPPMRGRAWVWAWSGRALTLLAAVLLLVATWPGWLQAAPQEWRRVGCGVAPDAGLERLARRVAAWRQNNQVPADAGWFNTNPAVLPYLVWYSPGARAFLDNQRLALYDAQAAADYKAVRKALAREGGDAGQADPRWRPPLRSRDTRFLIWYDLNPIPLRTSSPLPTLLAAPDEWPLLYLNGPGAVFGWRDPDPKDKGPEPFAGLEVNADREAFGPDAVPAPPGPAREAQPPEWWAALWTPEPPRPPESDEAAVRWLRFSVLQPRWRKNNEAKWDALWAGRRRNLQAEAAAAGLGADAPWAGPCQTLFVQQVLSQVPDQTPLPEVPQRGHELEYAIARETLDFGPPAELYLSVRAARRAAAVKPDDAPAYEYLAQTYFSLHEQTREGPDASSVAYPPGLPFPYVLRRVQIATALRRALLIDPDRQLARGLSAKLYLEGGYLDMALTHDQERLRILRETGTVAAELKGLEDEVKRLADEVKRREDKYELQAANKPVVDKADVALGLGLGQKALDELQKVDWNSLKDDDVSKLRGVQRELSLLVQTGAVEDVGRTLAEQEKTLKGALGIDSDVGLPAYEWLRLQSAAAAGDYAGADRWAEEIEAELPAEGAGGDAPLIPALIQLGVFGPALGAPGQPGAGPLGVLLTAHLFSRTAPVVAEVLGRRADLEAVRGWLALEAGDVAAARAHFETARRLAPAGQIFFHARPLTELGLEWLDAGK